MQAVRFGHACLHALGSARAALHPVRRAQLTQMHSNLLSEARGSIASTETQVQWLREERTQHEHRVRELQAAAPLEPLPELGQRGARRCSCCRKTCAIS